MLDLVRRVCRRRRILTWPSSTGSWAAFCLLGGDELSPLLPPLQQRVLDVVSVVSFPWGLPSVAWLTSISRPVHLGPRDRMRQSSRVRWQGQNPFRPIPIRQRSAEPMCDYFRCAIRGQAVPSDPLPRTPTHFGRMGLLRASGE